MQNQKWFSLPGDFVLVFEPNDLGTARLGGLRCLDDETTAATTVPRTEFKRRASTWDTSSFLRGKSPLFN
jgi:hypothetical protein